MKTWQWSLLCVLFCVVGINSVVYAWSWPSITLSVNGEDLYIRDRNVQVSPFDHNYDAPSLVSTPQGHLYVVYHDRDVHKKLLISRSIDGGQTWEIFEEFFPPAVFDVTGCYHPSITYLEKGTQKWLFVVFAGKNLDDIHGGVYILRLSITDHSRSLTIIRNNLFWGDWDEEMHPEICTDYPLETSNPFLYVTFSSVKYNDYDGGKEFYPVNSYRSQDLGQTWDLIRHNDPIWWDSQVERPKWPDIEYGTAGLFLVYHKWELDERKIVIYKSADRGYSLDLSHEYYFPANQSGEFPRVTVGIDNYTILVAYERLRLLGGNDDIEYIYSVESGDNWSVARRLATGPYGEYDVELGRSRSGGKFYAAYWQNDNDPDSAVGNIFCLSTDPMTPWSWESFGRINEMQTMAPNNNMVMSIGFDPIQPEEGIAIVWAHLSTYSSKIWFGVDSTPVNYWSWIPKMSTVTYTMTVENLFEDLNTLTVTNQLSDLVHYTSGAVAVNGVVQEPLAVTDGLWTYSTADLAYGDLLTFSFDVVVDAGIDPGDLISNLINVQYVYGLSNTLLEYSREVVIYVEAIPEPATWALIGLGLLGGGLLLRRKRRARTR